MKWTRHEPRRKFAVWDVPSEEPLRQPNPRPLAKAIKLRPYDKTWIICFVLSFAFDKAKRAKIKMFRVFERIVSRRRSSTTPLERWEKDEEKIWVRGCGWNLCLVKMRERFAFTDQFLILLNRTWMSKLCEINSALKSDWVKSWVRNLSKCIC